MENFQVDEELHCDSELFQIMWNCKQQLLIYARESKVITWDKDEIYAISGRAPLRYFQRPQKIWGLATKQQTQIYMGDTKVSTFPKALAGLYPIGKDTILGYRGKHVYFLQNRDLTSPLNKFL